MTSTSTAPRFAHLHLHSEYSLLDGGNKISPLLATSEGTRHGRRGGDGSRQHARGHGVLHQGPQGRRQAHPRHRGVRGDRAIATERKQTGIADGGFHLVLLAENNTGWRNLLKLSSDAYLQGFYYKPRMDKETLAQWSEGIIAINGHLGSSLAHHLLQYANTGKDAHFDAALEEARWHAQTFGPNADGEPCFYVEASEAQRA